MRAIPGWRRLDPLDRTVFALTLAVWAMHYVMRTMLSLMPGDTMIEPGSLIARTVVSSLGIAVCLAIHAILKKADSNRPWRLLGYAIALSFPALTWPIKPGTSPKNAATWPPMTSVIAGAAPLYGT